MANSRTLATVILAMLALAGTSRGAVSIETVTVGNPGNAGEWSSIGGHLPARICGAVSYTFEIGKYEVTTNQYCEFLNAVAQTDTYGLYHEYMDYDAYSQIGGCNIKRVGLPGSYSYYIGNASNWRDRPVNFVDWGDVARFANWMHNGQPTGSQNLSTTESGSYFLAGATTNTELLAVTRAPDATWVIPTEDEWYKAAYHKNDGASGNYFDYPTGTDQLPSNDLSTPDSGNRATFCDGEWNDPDSYTVGSPYWRTNVGEHENSASPYGTYGQGGNVWEWNETINFDGSVYRPVMRGGSYQNMSDILHASHRNNCHPSLASSTHGFRLALVPEPGSMILLAFGSLTASRRKKLSRGR